MKSFKQYTFSLPKYPSQTPPDDQGDPTKKVTDAEGDWVTGDPSKPIELSVTKDNNIKSVLKKAADDIQRDRE